MDAASCACAPSGMTWDGINWSNGHGKLPPLMMKPIMPVSLSPSLSRKRAREKTIAARVSR